MINSRKKKERKHYNIFYDNLIIKIIRIIDNSFFCKLLKLSSENKWIYIIVKISKQK